MKIIAAASMPFPRVKTQPPPAREAWAIREVLSALAVLGLVALVQISTLAGGNQYTKAEVCRSNHRTLVQAWLMYSDDNAGAVVPNDGSVGLGSLTSQSWATGWLDYTTNFDNVATEYLINFELNGNFGHFGPYLRHDAKVFRCPSDASTVLYNNVPRNRVRSVSMNNWMGGSSWAGADQFFTYKKLSEVGDPAGKFVMTDERADSINDSWLSVEMAQEYIVDYPGDYHSGGTWMSFADGHVEYRKWTDPRTIPAFDSSTLIPLYVASPGNSDLAWLRQHTSELK